MPDVAWYEARLREATAALQAARDAAETDGALTGADRARLSHEIRTLAGCCVYLAHMLEQEEETHGEGSGGSGTEGGAG
jgi:hypothetical protein